MTDAPTAHDIARQLYTDGWSPLPLPTQRKGPPPEGFTGYQGRRPTETDLANWDWSGNLAIRLPPDVVGIDVDAYNGGTLEPLERAHGELPLTVWSTSRDDSSGIALFRVPVGTTLATNPAPGVDMIQTHHRYMVVSPSVHPEGRRYQWVDEQSAEILDAPPPPDELPELPWAWIDALTVAKTDAARAATPDEVQAFVDRHTERHRPKSLKGPIGRLDGTPGGRHDSLLTSACWAMREAAAGWYPADEAIAELWAWWQRVMAGEPARLDSGEFGAIVMWAVAQAENDTERVAELHAEATTKPAGSLHQNPTDATNVDPRSLPADLWNTRPVLTQIRQAAHARARSADAVLLATLARVAALIQPTVVLPPIAGGRASLNFLGGVVASSGGGKSTAVDVARELVPIDRADVVTDVPPGSGEGLAELYFELVTEEGPDGKQRKVKRQTKTGALIYLDEGQALAEMGARRGATLLPTLRSAWSGQTLGQSNATVETHRVLKAHAYRMAIIVGFQLEYAANLIADAAGGTPQRFVFATAIDPTLPDELPDWPGELDIYVPPMIPGGTEVDFVPDVIDEIRQRATAATRGDYTPDPLDSHADLVRMKVAALLAILEHRLVVIEDDWELAGIIMRSSNAVRSWVIEYANAKERESEARYAAKLANRGQVAADTAEEKALQSGARSLARKVHKLGEPCSKRDLSAAVSSRHKRISSIDQMIDLAEVRGWIRADDDRWVTGDSRPT